MYRLENWSLTSGNHSVESGITYFQGNVYGHPRFVDGFFIHTTRIVNYENGVFETKSGSQYVLGEVDKEYEKLFPNAYQRLVKSAQTISKENE